MLRVILHCAGPLLLTIGQAASGANGSDIPRGVPATQSEAHAPLFAEPPAAQPVAQPAATRPATTPSTDVSDFLGLLTGNNSATVRRLGARQLLGLGSPDAIDRVRQLLVQPIDAAAVTAICEVISQTGLAPPTMLEPLVSLLADARPVVSEWACRALTATQDARVVTLVGDVAKDKKQPIDHRVASIRCLGRLAHEKQAVAALIQNADDTSRAIQAAVLTAMSDVAQERFTTLKDAKAWWSENRSTTESQWHRRNFGALQRRYVAAMSTQSELTQRVAALVRAEFLRTPEPDRPKALLALLKDDLPAVRELALDLVNTWITDRKEIGVDIRARLGELVDDPEGAIRRRAAKMVGDLRLTAEASRLANAIDREGDPEIRAALIDAAGRLDDRAFVAALVPRLNDDSTAVVSAAAGALGNLARRGVGRPEDIDVVSTALAKRLEATPIGDDMRSRLLTTMGVVGSEALRGLIVAELNANRSVATRCAALRGLGAYRDAKAAADIRPRIESPEPLERLAAVEALGVCGSGEADLSALFTRLDPAAESNAAVREQAWESYKSVAGRCPAATILAAADRFARNGTTADQQQRIELLRIAAQRVDELGPVERIAIQERIGDARMVIGDFKAAATAFEQAATGDDEATRQSIPRLHLKTVDARLRGGEDDEAVLKLTTALNGDPATDDADAASKLVLDEVQRRLTVQDLVGAIRLLDKCESLREKLGSAYVSEATLLRVEGLAMQGGVSDEEIDRLLTASADDAEAVDRLTELKVRVLARIHARLVRPQTTTAATRPADTQAGLIAVARRFAPDWRGFGEQATAAERSEALADLALQIRAAARAAATSQPAGSGTPG